MSKMKILFVDDEPSVLEGLRRMLRKQSAEWEMDFVASGVEALEKLDGTGFDVMVTDLQMPGMTGVELLEKTVAAHPEVGRIVLSGHNDESMAVRATQLAHQFLAKPTEPDALKMAVARARPQAHVLNNERIKGMIAKCRTLPVLPSICAELARLLETDEADARSVGRLISRDPGMSAKVLQLVNSSFFGIGRRVSNVEMAVSLLGVLRVRALVLRDQIFQAFPVPASIRHFSVERLWERSLQVAEIARGISRAERQGEDRPDQAFTAGLLHDVGVLLLAHLHSDYPSVPELACARTAPMIDVEQEILGMTHAEVGGYLLSLWGLPARIVEAIALHHDPRPVPYDGVCALTAVHFADALLAQAEKAAGAACPAVLLSPVPNMEYLERIGLTERLAAWKGCVEEVCGRPLDS